MNSISDISVAGEVRDPECEKIAAVSTFGIFTYVSLPQTSKIVSPLKMNICIPCYTKGTWTHTHKEKTSSTDLGVVTVVILYFSFK